MTGSAVRASSPRVPLLSPLLSPCASVRQLRLVYVCVYMCVCTHVSISPARLREHAAGLLLPQRDAEPVMGPGLQLQSCGIAWLQHC
jgi:hypothetical protein